MEACKVIPAQSDDVTKSRSIPACIRSHQTGSGQRELSLVSKPETGVNKHVKSKQVSKRAKSADSKHDEN